MSGRGFSSSKSRSALLEVEMGRFSLIRMFFCLCFVRGPETNKSQEPPIETALGVSFSWPLRRLYFLVMIGFRISSSTDPSLG